MTDTLTVAEMTEGLNFAKDTVVNIKDLLINLRQKKDNGGLTQDDMFDILGELLLNQQVILSQTSLLLQKQVDVSIQLGERP